MISVGAYEAKTKLAELLDKVTQGERIVITRHGVPVAILHPPDPGLQTDVVSLIADFRRFRKGRRLPWTELRAWAREGRD